MISAAEICYSKGFPLRKACTFLIIFFAFFLDGFGQDPASQTPDYDYLSTVDLVNLDITLSGVNTEDIPISIDVDPQRNLYVLTLGDGIEKRNTNGSIINTNFITGLRSPLDFSIDNNGFIYVADYSEDGSCSQNGKIKVYNPDGSFNRQFYTGIYRPLGIDVDSDGNIYVAEYNQPGNGCESDELSRVSIYNSSGIRIASTSNVSRPYRIAVSSDKRVYLSQEGGSNPAVIILDQSLNITGSLPNIQSPGSVVIDSFDFIHVVEYAGRIDFSRFINFENLSIGEIQDIAEEIDNGIDDNAFFIKVFSPNENFEFQYQQESDFPVDIAFNGCDRMYVNDGFVDGSSSLLFGYIPEEISFDLDIFQRTPAFDITDPYFTFCPSDAYTQLSPGESTYRFGYTTPIAADNCGVTVTRIEGQASGTLFEAGVHTITHKAVDFFGNTAICSFTFTLDPPNQPPSFENCSEDISISNESGECWTIVEFPFPTASDEDGNVPVTQIAGPVSGSAFNVGTTTITFSATDDENNTEECSFTVTVSDTEDPTITCPANIEETVAFGEDGKIVIYEVPTFDDNCPGDSVEQTNGLASGSEFPLGDTVNTFVVTDASGKTDTCSFTVTINEAEDTEPPVISCPGDITQENDLGECGAIITFADAAATDNSGNVTVTRTDETGLNSGDIFPIGETVISFQAIDQTGNTDNCSFTITVSDMESPTISCPDNREETVAAGSEGKTIIYDIPDFQDNCTGATITRIDGIASGNVFPIGPTTNTFRVTDAAGNISECSFTVTIVEEEDTDPPVINCPEDIIVINDPGVCGAIVEFDEITASDENEVSFTRTDDTDLFSGDTFPVGNTTLSFRATDAAGNSSNCSFSIIVSDEEEPEIRCVASYSVNVSPGQSKIIYPADLDSGTRDNCDIEDLSLSQDSFTVDDVGTVPVTLTATDPAGNSSSCTVNVEVILINNNQLSLSCPEDYPVYADENCEYVVPDFSEIVEVSPEGATIEQSIEPGSTTITNADPFITITASYEGQTETCDIYLVLTDEISPVIDNCPSNTTVTIAQGETYTLPDYRDQLEISDNCGNATVVQDPAPGTPISQDSLILFTATDGAGNTAECSFQLNIAEEGQLDISCLIEEYILSPNDNCEYLMPNLDDVVQYSPSEAEFNQSVAPGTELQEDTEVEVSVTFEGETKTCNLYVSLQDDVSPQAVCINALEIILDEGETRTLNASEIDNGSSDNCGEVSLSLSKNEFTTEDEGANTVILTVTDGAGNTSTCETIVTITVNNDGINQPPVAYDEEYTTNVNTQLNVSAENGVLVNDTDPENDELTAILDTDVDNGTLQLNSDGSFTYTPDNGFVGQDFFTYRANDGEYNSEVIFVSINVVDDTGDFGCTSQVVLGLGEEGEANLDIELLYYGNTDGIDLTADKLTFTCEDIGENVVTLMYTGAQEGFCEIPVMVLDDAPPVLDLRDISIDLDLEGNASISFEDINNGSFDVCDENVTYTLSKSLFTCKELGGNIIQVSAEDAAGNISTATVSVQVFAEEGICSEPLPGSEYIFVYPNPNSGSFKIATPGDVSIQRIEVFDHRGRFITARDYQANATEYSMELNPLQEAVYILKLETNEGEVVKRMIFER